MIRRNPESMRAVLAWWHDMHDQSGHRGDRAGVARLRHAGSVVEASMQPSTIGLCRALGGQHQDMNNIALIAAVLADLRVDERAQSIARALGGSDEASRLCKLLRFQRLLEATSQDAQLTAFRRALALLKNRGAVNDLAASLLEWNDPDRRDSRRQRWLYDYFHTNSPDPSKPAEATP